MTTCFYIAGPMRGIKHYNFPAFDAARDMLARGGFSVVSPADIDRKEGFDPFALPDDNDWSKVPEGQTSRFYMLRDTRLLAGCDSIYMLDGWQNSIGARAEHANALWLDMAIVYQTTPPEIMPSITTCSDEDEVGTITAERGSRYGPCREHFSCTKELYDVWVTYRLRGNPLDDDQDERCLKHAVYFILDKLTRAAHSPMHKDNWNDIEGYARCLKSCLFSDDRAE